MKFLILLSLLTLSTLCAELTNGNENCVACIGDTTKKLCRSSPSSPDVWCCDKDEFSVDCGSGTFGTCSDTLEELGENGKYLLCPNADDCGSDDYSAYSYSDTHVMTVGVPANGVCVIEVRNDQYRSKGLKLETDIQKDVDVHLFKKRDNDDYSDMGAFEVSKNDEGVLEYGYDVEYPYYAVFVVVPNNNRVGGFAAKARAKKAEGVSDEFPLWAILVISFGSLWIIVMFILITVCCCKKRRAKARMQQFYREGAYQKVDDEASLPDHQETSEQIDGNNQMNGQHLPPQFQPQNENSGTAYPSIETGVPMRNGMGGPLNHSDDLPPAKNNLKSINPIAPAKKI